MIRRKFGKVGVVALVVACGASSASAPPILCEHTGHYYDAIDMPGANWFEARAGATAEVFLDFTGSLACIGSAEENDFITANFLTGWLPAERWVYWLGGFQPEGAQEPDGDWHWVSGEPWLYENWAHGGPSNHTTVWPFENSLAIYTDGYHPDHYLPGRWNDLNWQDTESFAGYIIEFSPITSGDADRDGDVDLEDLFIVRNNFGQPGGWAEGDFSGDGIVCLADLFIVRNKLRHLAVHCP